MYDSLILWGFCLSVCVFVYRLHLHSCISVFVLIEVCILWDCVCASVCEWDFVFAQLQMILISLLQQKEQPSARFLLYCCRLTVCKLCFSANRTERVFMHVHLSVIPGQMWENKKMGEKCLWALVKLADNHLIVFDICDC